MTATDVLIATATRHILERCERLARCTEEPGQLTRTFLSPPMHDVHALLGEWMREADISVRVDAMGNLIGRYGAPDTPALLIGSHLDTVPNAGRYDGALGVLLALALVESLGGQLLPFAIEIMGFSEEEGVRFGMPYLGSLAISGGFAPSSLERRDAAGNTIADAIRAFGLEPADLPSAAYTRHQVVGYVEAHIEQGPVLEALGLPVGVVTAIAGQTRTRLTFQGQSSHAGTTPMPLRRDALVGAAEFIMAVEALGRTTEGLVATVGFINSQPNAGNVVPGQCEVSLDVRHKNDTVRESTVTLLLNKANAIAAERGLISAITSRNDFAAVSMDKTLLALLSHAVTEETRTPAVELVSGAGHDAAVMAGVMPAAMLFVRSPNGGLSHHPDEAVLEADVAVALRVLRHFIRTLEDSIMGKGTLSQ